MIQAIQKKLNNRKGFTLIELIVVIVILGILAAILVPTYANFADKAKAGTDRSAVANLKTGIAVANAEGKYASATKPITYTVTGTAGTITSTITSDPIITELTAIIPGLSLKYYDTAQVRLLADNSIQMRFTKGTAVVDETGATATAFS